jgi:hypothetical protein
MMAKTPDAVLALLEEVWRKGKGSADAERLALEEYVRDKGGLAAGAAVDIQPWDWRYYAEKVRGGGLRGCSCRPVRATFRRNGWLGRRGRLVGRQVNSRVCHRRWCGRSDDGPAISTACQLPAARGCGRASGANL